MNENQIDLLLDETYIRLHVQSEQFCDWLKKIFYLTEALHNEYNRFYQDLYFLHIYQFITDGKEYVEEVIRRKTSIGVDYLSYYEIKLCIDTIKESLTTEELDLLEYQRHCSCHMFQTQYELMIKKNGDIHSIRKGQSIVEQREKFREILSFHRSKNGYNEYFNNKLYPIIMKLDKVLNKVE